MKREKYRSVIAAFTTFFITLCLTAMIAILVGAQSLISETSIREAIIDAEYENNAWVTFNEKLIALGSQYGVGSVYFDAMITQRNMASDIQKTLDDTFDHRFPLIDTSGLSVSLDNRLMDFVDDEGLTWTNEIQAGILELSGQVRYEYISAVTIPYLEDYVKLTDRFRWPLTSLSIFLSIILVASIYFLYRLLPRLGFNRRIIQICIACAWTCIIIPTYLWFDGFYDRIRVQPYAFNRVLASFMRIGLERLIWTGILMMFVALALYFFTVDTER
jgi:hypothetical protein